MERHNSGPWKKATINLVYPGKLSFLIEGEIKIFHNKEKLKKFVTTKPALQNILNRLLHIEEKTRVRQEPFWASTPVNKEGKTKQQGTKNGWGQ
jgi:hypothetical protein